MDVENIADLDNALEKLQTLWTRLTCYDVSNEQIGRDGFWQKMCEDYLSDYSLDFFLSTSFEDDYLYEERIFALVSAIQKNRHLICAEDQDMSFMKMEDLNDDINRAYKET